MEQNNNARNVRPPTPPPSPPPQIQGPDVIAWVPWSLFSPYQTKTSSKPHVPDKIPELHGWKEAPLYDPTYYEGPSQGQHFPTGKLKISDQARRELENLFHEQAAEKMRNHWDRWEIYWQIWSHQMPVAAGYIAPNSGQHYIPPELYLNKQFAIYFFPRPDLTRQEVKKMDAGDVPSWIGRYILEVLVQHARRPAAAPAVQRAGNAHKDLGLSLARGAGRHEIHGGASLCDVFPTSQPRAEGRKYLQNQVGAVDSPRARQWRI